MYSGNFSGFADFFSKGLSILRNADIGGSWHKNLGRTISKSGGHNKQILLIWRGTNGEN